MKDLRTDIDDITEALWKIQAFVETLQNANNELVTVYKIPKGGKDYPYQMQVILDVCLDKVKQTIKDLDNLHTIEQPKTVKCMLADKVKDGINEACALSQNAGTCFELLRNLVRVCRDKDEIDDELEQMDLVIDLGIDKVIAVCEKTDEIWSNAGLGGGNE